MGRLLAESTARIPEGGESIIHESRISEPLATSKGDTSPMPTGTKYRGRYGEPRDFSFDPKNATNCRFELAEMQNLRVAAEVREGNPERTLSQEVHMFTQARALIEDMRNAFTIEDQGCIQRTEMLSTK